ncbi:MAG: DNA-processing protein DprA [Victivallales bacterium]|nr:DNA-processing protein DprA [Victivallales bacterium]MBQ6472462.1 DNA-processing protein DprA [Victivallales bacterium]
MERREAYIAMNLLPEIGPARLRILLEHFPDPRHALGAPVEKLQSIPRLGQRGAQILHDWERHCSLVQEIRRAEQSGVYLVTWEDSPYPAILKEIHDPPICLYVRGDLSALQNSSQTLAMVGSRFTTAYGESIAQSLASSAAQQGWIVVSGLARGIDTVCHRSVVAAGGRTIAVLGSGLDRLYPPENVELCRSIVQHHGAVISEFPLGTSPDRQNFPQRNRIISGLSRGTLVIQASLKSGSLITAALASEQGRTVFAVPGRVDSPHMQGCHALLKDGARLVESFQDVLEEFSMLPSLADTRRRREESEHESMQRNTPIPLPLLEYRLWEAIGTAEIGIDDLVAELQMPVSAILGALLSLEIKQLIHQLPGKRVRRVQERHAIPQG